MIKLRVLTLFLYLILFCYDKYVANQLPGQGDLFAHRHRREVDHGRENMASPTYLSVMAGQDMGNTSSLLPFFFACFCYHEASSICVGAASGCWFTHPMSGPLTQFIQSEYTLIDTLKRVLLAK